MPRDVSQNAPVTDSDRLVIKPRRKVVCSLLACQFVYLMKFTLRRRILGAADSGTMSICQGLDKSMLFWRNYTCMYIRQVYTLKIDKKACKRLLHVNVIIQTIVFKSVIRVNYLHCNFCSLKIDYPIITSPADKIKFLDGLIGTDFATLMHIYCINCLN